jgi:hypothetical protein
MGRVTRRYAVFLSFEAGERRARVGTNYLFLDIVRMASAPSGAMIIVNRNQLETRDP